MTGIGIFKITEIAQDYLVLLPENDDALIKSRFMTDCLGNPTNSIYARV